MNQDSILVAFGSAFASLVIGAAIAWPRVMSGKKRDENDQKFAEAQQKMLADMQALFDQQIGSLKKSNEDLSTQVTEMHALLDKYRIQLTKTKNLLVEFEGLLEKAGVVVPPETKAKFTRLVDESDDIKEA